MTITASPLEELDNGDTILREAAASVRDKLASRYPGLKLILYELTIGGDYESHEYELAIRREEPATVRIHDGSIFSRSFWQGRKARVIKTVTQSPLVRARIAYNWPDDTLQTIALALFGDVKPYYKLDALVSDPEVVKACQEVSAQSSGRIRT